MNKLVTISGHMVSSEEQLLKGIIEPTVVTVNDFDEEHALKFRKSMAEAMDSPQQEIVIVIDSFGGQCFALLSMLEAIDKAKKTKRVITAVTGKACSCGALLFTAGHERWVGPFSDIMMHEVSSAAWGKAVDVKAGAEFIEKLNTRILKMAAINIGKPENYWIDRIHENGHADIWMSPEEAVQINLATKIGIPTYTTTISITTKVD